MELRVSVKQKGAIFEGKAPEIINKAMTSAMYEATELLERKVKDLTPQGVGGAKGGLRSTIQSEVRGPGTPMVKGIVFTQSKYGEVIEKGRTAGKAMPPSGVLISWIEKKMGLSEGEAQRIEFVVRRAIGKHGFKTWPEGAGMFEDALAENIFNIEKIFNNYGFSIVAQLNA